MSKNKKKSNLDIIEDDTVEIGRDLVSKFKKNDDLATIKAAFSSYRTAMMAIKIKAKHKVLPKE